MHENNRDCFLRVQYYQATCRTLTLVSSFKIWTAYRINIRLLFCRTSFCESAHFCLSFLLLSMLKSQSRSPTRCDPSCHTAKIRRVASFAGYVACFLQSGQKSLVALYPVKRNKKLVNTLSIHFSGVTSCCAQPQLNLCACVMCTVPVSQFVAFACHKTCSLYNASLVKILPIAREIVLEPSALSQAFFAEARTLRCVGGRVKRHSNLGAGEVYPLADQNEPSKSPSGRRLP